ncbi:MAG: hypothetical protein K9I59_10415 [Chlorobium sp.]|uniref:hypothetical protein n=2 Tax=Chlorobium sp. TaxID=1095 RepID=UPI001D2D0295|nr:hypothetical protein [Chlorobium sp.]MBN1279230.1 hypothetical protein [Chlorobiaceae bacterium]MCF8217227.1 hypothetical protein [Chlorobium sp.]MCF8272085.1 hypothetical protein [Chlorobium sp.]MCF8288446.1 hypothetical protein [Chlorobium sp.]MCF8292036.1 hypothetical protein [Chlorobium sp.]
MKSHERKNRGCHTQCFVQKCSCGAFHLHYRYAMVVLHKQTLFQIMEECYRWEESGKAGPERTSSSPLIIMLGVVSLIVPEDDFRMFSKAVNDAVSEELGLPALIGQV